jgi:multidrug resistance efflux pump
LRPATAQLSKLEKRKNALLIEQSALKVKASAQAKIGSILYQPGDIVKAFDPVMTMHSTQPHSVKGYIHESVLNDVKIGQKVWIESLGGGSALTTTIRGKVVSLGSRMVEYPDRLKHQSMTKSFGREVIVELDNENELLLSEKVKVSVNQPQSLLAWFETHTETLFPNMAIAGLTE